MHGWKWYGRPSPPAGWLAGNRELFRCFDAGVMSHLYVTGLLANLIADLPGLLSAEPVRCLTFGGSVRADYLRAVRRFAVPPRPVRLDFRTSVATGDRIGYPVTALSSPFARSADEVCAAGCGAGSALALVLARSPFLENVRRVNLNANRLDFLSAVILANAPGLRAVEILSAKGNEFGPSGEVLLRSRFGGKVDV